MTVNQNESKNNKDKKNSDYQTTWEKFFEIEISPMDIYKERMHMARRHGSRKKYTSNQRLDERTKEQKIPPDGYVFDR
jgi:hypothetical protein